MMRIKILIYYTGIFVLFQLYSRVAYSQDFQTAGVLYNANGVKVELQYRLSDPCAAGGNGRKSRYRYVITGNSRGTDKYLNWKMDYYDCYNKIISQSNFVNIGNFDIEGIVESIDWNFAGNKLERPFHDISVTDFPLRLPSTVVTPQKSKAPTSISGDRTIIYGDQTLLSVQGGILGTNAQWKWYEGSCGMKFVKTGPSLVAQPLQDIEYFVRAESPIDTSSCISVKIVVDPKSKTADKIDGRNVICKGEKDILLAVNGGKLGRDADWVWYRDNLQDKAIGRGTQITVTPLQSTTYLVRAEGAANTTTERSITIRVVDERLQDPAGINSKTEVCKGTDLSMNVNGGSVTPDGQWCWYRNSVSPNNLVGKGPGIIVTPDQNSKYLVRGEGVCNVTKEVAVNIVVHPVSMAAYGIHNTPDPKHKRRTLLSVQGGQLGTDANWKWYKGDCNSGRYIGSGTSISVKVKRYQKYNVRAEGTCNTSSCAGTALYPSYNWRYFFINAGVIPGMHLDREEDIPGIVQHAVKTSTARPVISITFGSYRKTGWYVRGKYSIRYASPDYFMDNTEEINNPPAGNYYVFNGNTSENRWAVTAGLIRRLNKRSIYLNIGAGYGQRDLLWGVDEYSNLDNTLQKSSWAKVKVSSFSGIEGEAGLMIRFLIFNIMAGVNVVFPVASNSSDAVVNGYKSYADLYAGIGLTF